MDFIDSTTGLPMCPWGFLRVLLKKFWQHPAQYAQAADDFPNPLPDWRSGNAEASDSALQAYLVRPSDLAMLFGDGFLPDVNAPVDLPNGAFLSYQAQNLLYQLCQGCHDFVGPIDYFNLIPANWRTFSARYGNELWVGYSIVDQTELNAGMVIWVINSMFLLKIAEEIDHCLGGKQA